MPAARPSAFSSRNWSWPRNASVMAHVRDGSEGSMAGGNPDDMYRDPGLVTQREKHHRWKLDRHQILDYGLEGFLNPPYQWWENIDLLNRRVDFAVVWAGTVISAMICEDLAWVDPCQ